MCKKREAEQIPQYVIKGMSKIERTIYGINPCEINVEAICEKINTNKCLKNLTVYRGDNRKYDEIIKVNGFAPRYQLPHRQMLNLVANLDFDKSFRNNFWVWWKYPSNRQIDMNWNPFVATGIHDPHLGSFPYKIELKTINEYAFDDKLHNMKVVFNANLLEDSEIIGIQIDSEEIIFGTNIPSDYITPYKNKI